MHPESAAFMLRFPRPLVRRIEHESERRKKRGENSTFAETVRDLLVMALDAADARRVGSAKARDQRRVGKRP